MSDENYNEGERFSGNRRFVARPKICQFCADKSLTIDYKQLDYSINIESIGFV